ncbi:MAG: methyl-accepting chemotaxis protein [Deltaproteobacteria bacterium]|nr:methyl-accepting chemotaxis protein [Deltaproteobacteria bacterium]
MTDMTNMTRASGGGSRKRKKVFIKKRFQADFSVKFLILIVIESLLGIGLFSYLSRDTMITGWSGSELVMLRTGDYFLPTLFLANLAIIGVTAVSGFIFLLYASHKIAGPLYRFEKSLEDIGAGDLTLRLNLRSRDQLTELAGKVNEFTSRMDNAVSSIQSDEEELERLLLEIHSALSSGDRGRLDSLAVETTEKLARLKKSAGYFTTSRSPENA